MAGMNLTPEELAARWGYALSTLSNFRSAGGGPRYIKFGRKVLYPVAEVEAWERSHLQKAVGVPAEQ